MNQLGLTVRQLEYFTATVDLGTFSAAGEYFHISQSAISLAVTELERTLGVQLLIRRPAKGPTLTASGRDLLPAARRVLAEARELESQAFGERNEVGGRLILGSFPTITPHVVGRLLEGVATRFPALSVDLVEDSVDGLQHRLRDGSCDVAILYDLGIRDGIAATPLYSCAPYAVLPGGHPRAGSPSVALAELAADPMIMIDLPPSVEYFEGVLARAGCNPRIRYRAGSIETVRTLVGRGMGWSLLLHRPAMDTSYDGSTVVSVTLSDVDDSVDVLLARSADVRLTRRVEAFSGYCVERLAADT